MHVRLPSDTRRFGTRVREGLELLGCHLAAVDFGKPRSAFRIGNRSAQDVAKPPLSMPKLVCKRLTELQTLQAHGLIANGDSTLGQQLLDITEA